ncbi:hypothetical protein BATDEDRAFT_89753 [Batrachochytrium dendrobatidis JAM81]|uniref:Myb/SANT-like domain-containing protein n=2 Tax=Batrachochytrium dendrobatidis TaxID=109871 RepID=F4P5V1_BATDJ|nr:uncharacterized protein BATDEDRAFT_89753 [Batrachochytrium dendrobatidis JAM81]EGF79490.1 hypothetical protein BATDEDRAFT_89753 [Batrachochytrium dendrobatidis JAM81]|eukprot:XP_006680175.1 hypothetical protein BATDEDRAFT_89753 [Batrachochytrium dendrobatidis JAM81]
MKINSVASWTDENKSALASVAKAEHIMKMATGAGGFKKEGWVMIVDEFNKLTGNNYDYGQLKNQFNALRAKYKLLRAIKDNSNFGWDEESKLPTASDQVWADFISVYPRAADLRTHPLYCYDDLHVIFADVKLPDNLASSSPTPSIAGSQQPTPYHHSPDLMVSDAGDKVLASPLMLKSTPKAAQIPSQIVTPAGLPSAATKTTSKRRLESTSSSKSHTHAAVEQSARNPTSNGSIQDQENNPDLNDHDTYFNKHKRHQFTSSLVNALLELAQKSGSISESLNSDSSPQKPSELQQAIISFEKAFQTEVDALTRCTFIQHLREENAAEMYNAMLPDTRRAYVMSVCDLQLPL